MVRNAVNRKSTREDKFGRSKTIDPVKVKKNARNQEWNEKIKPLNGVGGGAWAEENVSILKDNGFRSGRREFPCPYAWGKKKAWGSTARGSETFVSWGRKL